MTNIATIKRQNEIIELLADNEVLAKLNESNLACLLGYLQGMIANAELNNEYEKGANP